MENKKPIGIVVDEGADLPQEIIDKYQIGIVPLSVHWPEVENIPGNNIFQKIRELEKKGNKSCAKTSQPSPKSFVDAFSKQLQLFEKVICLTVTSKHSGTYNSACQAKKYVTPNDNVDVIDSLNGTAGFGIIVLKALDLVNKGKTFKEVLEGLENYKNKASLRIFIDDPGRLEASGRMSSTMADLLRKAQKIGIRPVIGLKEGKLALSGVKFKAKDIPTALFNELKSQVKESGRIRIVITHGDDIERANSLKEMIEKNLNNTEIAFVSLMDSVVGSLLGPGAVALGWGSAED